MAKRTKSARESLKDILLNTLLSGKDGMGTGTSKLDLTSAKDILNTTLSWAGKSKDDFIQMVSREAGQALAQALEAPLKEILKDQKIHMTFELRPKKEKTSSSKGRK